MLSVQKEITARAIELLNLGPGPKLLLDVGCGSGLSGQGVSEHGHSWIGLDISSSMLQVANETLYQEEEEDDEEDGDVSEEEDDQEEEEEEEEDDEEDEDMDVVGQTNQARRIRGRGDLILHDMGQGLNFRPNSFDGCISISAVQWLCNAYHKSQIPQKRLRVFFTTLYSILRRGARAAIQLYPESPAQMEMITNAAMGAGFTGGVVVDYPNSTKAKKFYLVLFAGGSSSSLPKAKGISAAAQTTVQYETKRGKNASGRLKRRDLASKPEKKSRDWILNKKESQRRKGKQVRPDSKFTGRKRKPKF